MISRIGDRLHLARLPLWIIAAGVLLGAAVLGRYLTFYQSRVLALFVAGLLVVVLLSKPIIGVLGMVPAALVLPFALGTGTAVEIHKVTLLVGVLLGIWVLDMMRRNALYLAPSRANRPLLLFLAAGLLSLVVGVAAWDPIVPRPGDFLTVQLAQWAVFAFSAGAFWLTGNLIRDELWLRRLTWLFLVLAGGLAILYIVPPTTGLAESVATFALHRAPFWMLLVAVAGGQLLFNRRLPAVQRLFLWAVLGAALVYVFFQKRDTASNWIGVVAALGTLAWLRWPRLRWPVIAVLIALLLSGLLTSTVYEFAGGEAEWVLSGGSRLALYERVVEVTLRNPITGLGPAAYRQYARVEPLYYNGAYWVDPWVSSHNNYVDLFSHVGLLGIGIFFWFAAEIALLGTRLRAHYSQGFAAGYVNGALAAGAGALVLMLFADWILPFVYNVGFPGFQASVLVWLFLGGLVALEQMANRELAA
jgi:hypothetical protein